VVNGIPVVQARSSGRAVGVIDIPLTGTASPRRPQVRSVTSDSITPDPVTAAIVAEALAGVADRVNAFVVDATERLPRSGDQYALGNLIADAQRAAGRGDAAVMNNGGIRAELRAGIVRWGDLHEIQPFENRLVVVRVRGAALRRYLEDLVRGSGVRYHVSGVSIDYDPAAPVGARLRQVTMADGRPLDDRRTYRVVMTNFLAAGGDGAALSQDAMIEELDLIDLDVLVAYLRALPGGRLELTDVLTSPRIRALR
jgi:5'-nucleotidase